MYGTSTKSLKPNVEQDLILNKATFVMHFDINAEFLVFLRRFSNQNCGRAVKDAVKWTTTRLDL